MKQWYVVQTHARAEQLAKINLKHQGFEVYLPCYPKRRSHARRTDWVKAPLFPRYLFVLMDTETTAWRAVNSTIGVQNIVSFDSHPAAIPEGVIEEIITRENSGGLVATGPKVPFRPGEEVRVLDGALADQVGLFDCAVDEERVFILLDLLGRQVRVRVASGALTACA